MREYELWEPKQIWAAAERLDEPVKSCVLALVWQLAKQAGVAAGQHEVLETLVALLDRLTLSETRRSCLDPLEAIRQQLADDDCLWGFKIERVYDRWQVVVSKGGACGIGEGHTWTAAYDAAKKHAARYAVDAGKIERNGPEGVCVEGGVA